MKTLYSNEQHFWGGVSIFLAGPTPRSQDVPSWRPQAIQILEEIGFKGTVLIPEDRDGSVKGDYTNQAEWEYAGLSNSTVIAFWVPRQMDTMPALTTNVEFGFWMARNPRKVVYGRPDTATSVRYLDWMYHKFNGGMPHQTIEETLQAALQLSRHYTRYLHLA